MGDSDFNIDKSTYDRIAKVIESDSSPVGIDARKTHVLILKMLLDINQRLDNLERQYNQITNTD